MFDHHTAAGNMMFAQLPPNNGGGFKPPTATVGYQGHQKGSHTNGNNNYMDPSTGMMMMPPPMSSDVLAFFQQQQQRLHGNDVGGGRGGGGGRNRSNQQQQGGKPRSPPNTDGQQPQQHQSNNHNTGGNHLSSAEKEELLSRTIHLRFLPTCMKQGELAALCTECGPVNRVRICGGQNNTNQNWIYGFVEFSNTGGANKMMKKSGMELHNGAAKPPLRLKCHVAREPIVDRVFHDADTAKGTPCQFGHGAFASRTLKEALDSYFSLVTKTGTGAALKDHVLQLTTAMSAGASGGGASAGPITNGTPNSTELRPSGFSDSSSVNGRTPTLPPSPQLFLPTATVGHGTANAGTMSEPNNGRGSNAGSSFTALPPPLRSVLHHSLVHGPHQHHASPAGGNGGGNHSNQTAAKISTCMAYLDAAMRAGSGFATTNTATRFFDAMGPLHSLHETLNTMSPPASATPPPPTSDGANNTTTGGGWPVDDAHANTVRSLRIAAYVLATHLHALRGSLAEMLPCITKAMDVIAAVSMAPIEKPSALHVPDTGHDDDDDEAFLSALSLVHVSQPSAVISQHAYETAVQHQCFLVHALLALGFAVEGVNSLIARCAFTAARRRAFATMGASDATLDRSLCAGGLHDLAAQLLPGFRAASDASSHQRAPFSVHFFQSYAEMPSPVDVLPPNHCISVFPQKNMR